MYPNYMYPKDSVPFVNGIAEVDSWVVQRGQSVYLFDRNQNVFYVKSVSDNGMPNPIEVYDYTKRELQNPKDTFATKQDLDELKKMIEEVKNAV